MCKSEDLVLISEAKGAAEVVLQGVLGLSVDKATTLSTRAGFDRAVAVLAAKLRHATRGAEAAAVRDAVRTLDVDWKQTTATERRRLISMAMAAARKATDDVPRRIEAPFSEAARAVVGATRADARRLAGMAISADFNALDRRIMEHIVSSQGNFVRDAYGRRVDAFGAMARQIVANGLEQGAGRADIAAALGAAARHELIERAPFYWEVVAAAFTGRGRSFAQISTYAEAGIWRYRIEAVLDEATTPICRYLHGKTFEVAEAIQRFDRVSRLSRPEDIKRELPWVRQQRDARSGLDVLFIDEGAGRLHVAEVVRSGVGERDDQGEFRPLVSDESLSAIGLGFPPYHGLCRTDVVAGPM